jgi:hypothetical protein
MRGEDHENIFWLEVTDFVERQAVGGAGGVAVRIAGVALRADIHAVTLLQLEICLMPANDGLQN